LKKSDILKFSIFVIWVWCCSYYIYPKNDF